MYKENEYSAVPVKDIPVVREIAPIMKHCINCREPIEIGSNLYIIERQRLCEKCAKRSIMIYKAQGWEITINGIPQKDE